MMKTGDFTGWPEPGDDLPDLASAFRERSVRVGSLTTGAQLVVHDPFDGPEGMDPLPLEIPAGEHPLHLGIVKSKGKELLAAAALVVSSGVPTRWERLCAYEIDSGFAAFLEPGGAFWLDAGGEQTERVVEWSEKEKFPERADFRFFAVRGRDLIALRSGKGRFVVYVARAADGSPVVVATGFGVLPRDRARKGDKATWDVPVAPRTRLPLGLDETAPSNAFERELSETVELVLDGRSPVCGRERVVAALEKELVGWRVGGGKQDAAGARAVLLTGQGPQILARLPEIVFAEPDPSGEIEIQVVAGKISHITITRAQAQPLPALEGKLLNDIKRELEAAGYNYGTFSTRHDDSPDGTVLSQSRSAGSVWPLMTSVDVVISRGPRVSAREHAVVPDVRGLDEGEARSALRACRLSLEIGKPLDDSREPVGKVAAQEPGPGTRLEVGMCVVVHFPAEEAKVFLPTLDGLSLKDAEFRLKLVGLKKGKVEKRSGEGSPGTVLASDPPGGSDVAPGSKVNLVVSQG
jgi:beta-lactam-binding protein with PASTA domain